MKLNLTKSFGMQNRAKGLIPGMTQLLSKRPDMFSLGVWPGYFKKAKGVEVWDLDGNNYIDMSIGGIGATVLGYADPDVDNAVIEAIKNGNSSSLNCFEEIELAELLCGIHPWAEMVRYARSGGEAMAIAVRIARAHTGKDKIAFCGYHGWHDWYLSANLGTENALGGHLLPGLSPVGVPKGLTGTAMPFRYNHIEELKKIFTNHKNELAAIVMEPVRNENPKNRFLDEVRKIADKTGTVLIFDEISSGFRLNSGGAHLLFNVIPDIAVFSKSLGNGYPIAAIIGIEKIMESAQKSFISSTMWTERVGPVAALATIRKYQSINAGEHLVAVGEKIQNGWRLKAEECGLRINVNGIPPLSHFEFEYDNSLEMKAYFVQCMLEKGFLASNLFYAMYTHQNFHVEQYLQAVSEVFKDISELNQEKDFKKQLKGKPATAGFKRLT